MNRVLFAVFIFAAGAFAQEPAAGFASLTGRITDASGQPIRKAGLTLRGSPQSVYTAASNADGTFSFDGITPGGYTLSVERAGYLPKMYRASLHETFSTIALAAGQRLTGIDLKLARAVTISGRVLDADGDPVANVPVRLLRRTYLNGGGGGGGPGPTVERTANTDESGKYSIPNLAPGLRYLSAGAGSGSVLSILGMRVAHPQTSEYYANTWYPSGKDESEATAIQILHDDMQGLDIRPSHAGVSGKRQSGGNNSRPSDGAMPDRADARGPAFDDDEHEDRGNARPHRKGRSLRFPRLALPGWRVLPRGLHHARRPASALRQSAAGDRQPGYR